MRALSLNITDTHFGIWQDNPDDPTFRTQIYGGLIRQLRDRGWTVGRDPEIHRRFRTLSPSHRLAKRGDLRAEIELSGRVVKIEFWAKTWPLDNPNGHRHDFRKRDRLSFIDRLRVDLEFKRIEAWLRGFCEVKVEDRNAEAKIGPGALTALQWIENEYAASWHRDKDLGRPKPMNHGDDRAKDGTQIVHGATVWFADPKGRIGRGTAYYRLGGMWTVVVGRYGRNILASHEILTSLPTDLRRKRNEHARRARLERELERAIRASRFERAALLKRILFGEDQTFMIWARDHRAYYRANYSGYASDSLSAGRYTRDEAERECRRVPHELEMVDANGVHTRFDREAA